MKYLIDTHTFIWAMGNTENLSKKALAILSDTENEIYISMMSFWEMSIKINKNKLSLGEPLHEIMGKYLKEADIRILDLKTNHILINSTLPELDGHKDPFDRMLVSQAISENMPIISKESKKFSNYVGLDVIW